MNATMPRKRSKQQAEAGTWVVFLTHRHKLKQAIKLVPVPPKKSPARSVADAARWGFPPPPPPTTTSPRRALRFATKRAAQAFLKSYHHPDYVGTVGTLPEWVPKFARPKVYHQVSFLDREEVSHAESAVVPVVALASSAGQPLPAVPDHVPEAPHRG